MDNNDTRSPGTQRFLSRLIVYTFNTPSLSFSTKTKPLLVQQRHISGVDAHLANVVSNSHSRTLSPHTAHLPHFFTLVIVVVVFPSLLDIGSPFSTSRSCLGLLPFPGGGELRRIPVLRFWRLFLLSGFARPVKRRDARRIDCRMSHWRFFASHQRVAEPTMER